MENTVKYKEDESYPQSKKKKKSRNVCVINDKS